MPVSTNPAKLSASLKRLAEKQDRSEQFRVYIDALLNEHDVARITGLSVAAIRRRRLLRQEPKYLKLNTSVRYRAEDIDRWLNSCQADQGSVQPVSGIAA